MRIVLQRISNNGVSTLGDLMVNGLQMVTLEDAPHPVKIYGETRIPAGRYEVKLRTEGRMHNSYLKRIPNHKGMLWLQDVPNYSLVYIHIGNDVKDTLGCILVGSRIVDENFIAESTVAYLKLYACVMEAFNKNEEVFIDIFDEV